MYDPYLVLSASALVASPELERELETVAVTAGGGGGGRMRRGVCGTIELGRGIALGGATPLAAGSNGGHGEIFLFEVCTAMLRPT